MTLKPFFASAFLACFMATSSWASTLLGEPAANTAKETNPAVSEGTLPLELSPSEEGNDIYYGVDPSNVFGPASTEEIKTIVEQYMIDNADLLLDLIDQRAAFVEGQQVQLHLRHIVDKADQMKETLLDSNTSTSFGPKDATITAVYFQDFDCAPCASMEPVIHDLLEENDVRVVNRYLPGQSHDGSTASMMAFAVGKVDPASLIDVHTAFYEEPGLLTYSKQRKIVESRIDRKTLDDVAQYLLESGEKFDDANNMLETNFELANELEVQGSPLFLLFSEDDTVAFFEIDDERSLKQIIDSIPDQYSD